MAKKFKGELARPIKPRDIPLLTGEAEMRELAAGWTIEDFQRLLLLCEHYGIPIDARMFPKLALHLARDFVPGFQEERPRGRKSKWKELNMGALVVEIERLVQPGDDVHGVSWAAVVLAKKEPWKSFLADAKDPAELIRHVYYGFKDKQFADISRKLFRGYKQKGDLAGWDRHVTAVCK
jgi:hypothetical protein